MEELIKALAPFLSECEETVEAKRVEMCLVWSIPNHEQSYIWNAIDDAKRGQYSAYGLICYLHDYLKARNYF